MANLEAQINKILTEFAEEVHTQTDEIGLKLAKAGARQINSNAKVFNGSRYSRSWTTTTEKARTGNTFVIHSKIPGLPHLLENGHASRNGGRVSGRPHIQPDEEELIKKYQEEVIDVIQGR